MDLTGKRILICEEALTDYAGHFYSWIKAIRAIHMEAGAEVLVACNKNVKEEIRKEFKAFPIYKRNSWSGRYYSKHAWKRYLFVFKHNYNVWKETRGLLKTIGHVDCILLTATRIYQLMAWRQLCRSGLGKKFDRLIIFQLTSEAIYNESFTAFTFKRTSLLMKTFLKSYKRFVDAGKVVLAGDSHITCHEYETLSGIPFKVFPSPAVGLEAIHNDHLPKPDDYESTTTFVTLGVSLFDKGIDILQKSILLLLQEEPALSARFIIQWGHKMVGYDGNTIEISDELRKAPQVKLIEQSLSEEAYKDYMHQADFIILPYRLKVYFNRLSGVAVEAACAGIPMIVTKNSWLEWAMNSYGSGVAVTNENYEDLAEKIRICIREKKAFQKAAVERKKIAIEMNSSARYLDCVWK